MYVFNIYNVFLIIKITTHFFVHTFENAEKEKEKIYIPQLKNDHFR